MANGYTAKLEKGEITSLKEFAFLCAHAFGANFDARDRHLDASVPIHYEVNQSYERVFLEAKECFDSFSELSDDEKKKEYEAYVESKKVQDADRLKQNKEYHDRKKIELDRYNNMLEKISRWNPPTEEHNGIKEFMISQIEEAICWGGHKNVYVFTPGKTLDYEAWYADKFMSLQDRLNREQRAYLDHVKSINESNKWIKDLNDSLDEFEEREVQPRKNSILR